MRLAPRFSIDLADSVVTLDVHGVQNQFPREILSLLALYQEPHTLEQGLQFLSRSAKGMQGLAEAFARLISLCEQGVLVPDDGNPPLRRNSYAHSFGPPIQIRMLEDRIRTSRFTYAIRRTVRTGDVVVDLGTGSGVLAVAAAQAGAKHVYAIEFEPIADVAEQFFQGSGFADRITLIRGMSTAITLPERGDVLVSEVIGEEPLAERILETTSDAVARLLKPGARLIPSALRIYVTPVVVPEKVRQQTFFTPEVCDRWQRWYGLPFRALLASREVDPKVLNLVRTFVNPWSVRRWPFLGPPAILHAIDLAARPLTSPTSDTTLCFEREGDLGGMLVHFEADLAADVRITTEPTSVARRISWRIPLWLLPSIIKVQPGMRLGARFGFQKWNYTFDLIPNPTDIRSSPLGTG